MTVQYEGYLNQKFLTQQLLQEIGETPVSHAIEERMEQVVRDVDQRMQSIYMDASSELMSMRRTLLASEEPRGLKDNG